MRGKCPWRRLLQLQGRQTSTVLSPVCLKAMKQMSEEKENSFLVDRSKEWQEQWSGIQLFFYWMKLLLLLTQKVKKLFKT